MRQGTQDLNEPQRAAVEHGDGPLLVLAGAGTGKTRVLTRRIARLVERGIEPHKILAVTFTNKAAGEMRERIEHLLGRGTWGMWIGTFHATCARLLRTYPDRVGLTRNFTIFDDDDQKRLASHIMRELDVSERVSPRAVLSRIDKAKTSGNDPAEMPTRDVVDDVMRRVYPLYQERLARENAVDFNDLILKVLELQRSDIGEDLATRFEHVLVDEFQDTNLLQYRLVQHFARGWGNLCVVGDDDQSIYRWRGAEPRNLLDFDRDYPDAVVVKLEQNYRSTRVILAAANGVISRNTDRHEKALWTDREGGEPVLLEENERERDEAEFVADGIRGLFHEEQRPWREFAVLYRTHAQSRVIEENMRSRRIPYRIVGGISFFQRREVKDVTEYLRLLVNPLADSALERVINVPARGIGGTTIDRVRAHARNARISMLEAARSCAAGAGEDLGAAARRKLGQFVALADGLRDLVASGTPVARVLVQVIERTGYRTRLETENKDDAPDRLRNVEELVAAAAAYDEDAGADATLGGFLERVALTSTVDDVAGEDGAQAVTLMTIHAAKGLEFPVVFLAGMEEGLFPLVRDSDPERDIEEERRLAYVAMTRAMDRLVLSYALRRRTYDEFRNQTPSRFLADVPPECIAVRSGRQPLALRQRSGPRHGSQPGVGLAAAAMELGLGYAADMQPGDDFDQRPASSDEAIYYMDEGGGEDSAFPRGSSVRHKIFGVGAVEEATGQGPNLKLVIRFPVHGRKTILARFVERA